MGVHRFYPWFKAKFGQNIKIVNCTDTEIPVEIDNLMIDLNGIFHSSAQRIYEYGNNKPQHQSLIRKVNKNNLNQQIKMFEDVCREIDSILKLVKPRKRLILCSDGVAPTTKLIQQRSRRFKSAQDNTSSFDSCCISPGTIFLDHLTKYIDFYIRKKITEDSQWSKLHVIFSNEKVPSEGEQKIMKFVRFNKIVNPSESYCLHGMDADLIMLALAANTSSFYILREDLYTPGNKFNLIDIVGVYDNLLKLMKWENEDKVKFHPNYAINDFVLLCFTTGNDFLPNIPSIEIVEGGIDVMLDIYRKVCSEYGHLTRIYKNDIHIVKKSLEVFLGTISLSEKILMEEKLNGPTNYFEDEIIERNVLFNEDGTKYINFKKYRDDYYNTNFVGGEVEIKNICHEYIEGMQWVLTYYTKSVPSWKWFYKFHYAPLAGDLAKYMQTFKFPTYPETTPKPIFQQLLCILSPKSANLIPYPLNTLLTNENSPIIEYYPKEFRVDLSGKRKEWEGRVILPILDQSKVEESYNKLIDKVSQKDLKRNIYGKTYQYCYQENCRYCFDSFYGVLENCKTHVSIFNEI